MATELSHLELEFLDRIDWKIVPDPEVLVDYYHSLVGRADRYILEDDAPSTKIGVAIDPIIVSIKEEQALREKVQETRGIRHCDCFGRSLL